MPKYKLEDTGLVILRRGHRKQKFYISVQEAIIFKHIWETVLYIFIMPIYDFLDLSSMFFIPYSFTFFLYFLPLCSLIEEQLKKLIH